MSKAQDDPGIVAVDSLFRDLMVDKEWSTRRDRGFTWWGYRLAQHVAASPRFQGPDGATASRLNVWTDLVSDVEDHVAALRLCSVVNMQQTMSALVYDAERRTMSESFTAVLYADTVRGWAKVMATAAVIQNTAAHSRCQSLAEVVGGRPNSTDHPVSGQRPEMDDMLNTPEQVIVPAGSGPSAFGGPLVERLDAMEMPLWTVHTGSSSGFTVEVEYSSDVPAAMAIAQGVPAGTALVQVSTEEGHPEFGSGALVLLKLPVTYDDEGEALEAANQLNCLETAGESGVPMMGAWCSEPDNDGLAFVSFVPSLLARPGVLENFVIYDTLRAKWAYSVLVS